MNSKQLRKEFCSCLKIKIKRRVYMKKKILAVLLTAGMAASLFAGCGDADAGRENSKCACGVSQ